MTVIFARLLTGQVFVVTVGAANLPLGDVEVFLLEKKEVLEFLSQKKQLIAGEIRSRQRAIDGYKTDLEKAQANLDARAAQERAFLSEGLQDFLQTNTYYQAALKSYDAMLSEFRNSERPKLVLLQKQIVQAHAILVKHAHDLNDQNTSASALTQSPRYGSGLGARYGRAGPPSSVWGDPSGHLIKSSSGSAEFEPFIARAENLYGDVSTILESIDNRVLLQDSFHASLEPSLRTARGDEELFVLRSTATLDTIIERVRAKEIELLTLKSDAELKADQMHKETLAQFGRVRKDAEAQLEAVRKQLNEAELSLARFKPIESYFSGFSPKAIVSARTDATGSFSLRYHLGAALTVFARANRQVLDQTEHYFWLVNAPTNLASAQIFLSNSKLVTVDPDGYFGLKPE
ncbi:MAG: hypothetical protein ACLQVY_25400 [Limisphaerales bacterium]